MSYLDPPDDLEPPDWYMLLEDALNEPKIPESVATAVRKVLDDWCKASDYPDDYEPPQTSWDDNGCRTCGKPAHGCIYCSEECAPPCVHGNRPDHCDACDHLGDIAYDAMRENR